MTKMKVLWSLREVQSLAINWSQARQPASLLVKILNYLCQTEFLSLKVDDRLHNQQYLDLSCSFAKHLSDNKPR